MLAPRRGFALVVAVVLLATLAPGTVLTAHARSSVHVDAAADEPDSVTVAGSVQSELGCSGDWQPSCEVMSLAYDPGGDVWSGTFHLPAGDWEYKAALNGSWDENYGMAAQRSGRNIPLGLDESTAVTFWYDTETHWLTDDHNSVIVTAPGDYQREIGCQRDWDTACMRSWLKDPDGDGVFAFTTSQIPAGGYQARVVHGRGSEEDHGAGGRGNQGNVSFRVPQDDTPIEFIYDSETRVLTIGGGETAASGDIAEQRAHWISHDTVLWDVDTPAGATYRLRYSLDGALQLTPQGIVGGVPIALVHDPDGMTPDIRERYPWLESSKVFRIDAEALGQVRTALRGQLAVTARNAEGELIDATGLQIPGVLDDLYANDANLGVTWDGGAPTLRVWAPTARSVTLHLFDGPETEPESPGHKTVAMMLDPATGVWSATGDASWDRRYYLYEVEVYVGSTGRVERNLVTDPYSASLAANSARSQIVDLRDGDLRPRGWDRLNKPKLEGPEHIALYELHVRDFSMTDETVPAELRGTYLAFTRARSDGMRHLRALARSGMTHVHLLPVFDIATIQEVRALQKEPEGDLGSFPPDSPEQQARVAAVADEDGFNWGYDPYHYTTPEGSYATDPQGPARIREFRRMVAALNRAGLRVVMDVVYNHTHASGQAPKSVLDRIVPSYYHRLLPNGEVATSTCCPNTATEHAMMAKLMVDSVVTWAKRYKIDGFRFDLMGHHSKVNMLAVRSALDALTLADDGVDGSQIYVYGEGWNFGEVADNARFIQATQPNMAGTGVGTFNDRMRDAVRGGGPFDADPRLQGFASGLYSDPNDASQGSDQDQLDKLLLSMDQIRVGLAGNLRDYPFLDRNGNTVTGADVPYGGGTAGYTSDPQENIVYTSAHDNETLFDVLAYKLPPDTPLDERVRMQTLALSTVAFAQGVPFFHAGTDMLRSKSLDRNSFDSGDWFNKLDFGLASNNFGVGLPPASENEDKWPFMRPLLGDGGLKPSPRHIDASARRFRQLLAVRRSSSLFRLQTGEQVKQRVRFHNTGPGQIPGLIVMTISDTIGEDLDPRTRSITVLFNASDTTQRFLIGELADHRVRLHPLLRRAHDSRVRQASFDRSTGEFSVPPHVTAVFVER